MQKPIDVEMPRQARWLAAAGAALLLSGPAVAQQNVLESMPSETHAAFWVDDLSTAMEQAEKNPLFQFFRDKEHGAGGGAEAVTGVIRRLPLSGADPLRPMWDILLPAVDSGLRGGLSASTSVFQFSGNEILDTFGNSFAIYSTLYDMTTPGGTEIVEWDLVLAADFPEEDRPKVDAFLQKALAGVPANARRRQKEFAGHSIFQIQYYLDETPDLPGELAGLPIVQEVPVIIEYAFVDNVLLLAEGRGDPLERVVRALSEPGAEAFKLTGTSRFQQARAALPDDPASFHFYYDLAHHVREWGDHRTQADQVRLMQALGLASAGPLLVRGKIDEEGTRLQAALVSQAEPKGFFGLLIEAPENPFRDIRFVPEDAEAFGSFAVDMERLYIEIRSMLSVLNPNARLVMDAVVTALQGYTNINIQQDLLSGSRGELVSYIRPVDERPSSGFLLPLKGDSDTVAAVNIMAERLTEGDMQALDMESSDFLGHRLWESRVGPMTPVDAPRPSFAATPQGFIFSNSGAEARDLLRRISGEAAAESAADSEKLRRFIEQISERGTRGFVYIHIEPMVAKLSRGGAGGMPPEAVRRAFGDAWWTLNARDRRLLFTYQIELPPGTQ